MNFLNHSFLAGADPGLRLGGMLGDFVKGTLPAGLPPEVAAGVRLHRCIDAFADTHPAFRQSRARVTSRRRRYAGIMIDLFYDHFLAVHWQRFSAQPLREFTAEIYSLLSDRHDLLPPALARLLPAMVAEDWLASYRALASVGAALDRISERRLSRPNPLRGAVEELADQYSEFEADFFAFVFDAQSFARSAAKNQ